MFPTVDCLEEFGQYVRSHSHSDVQQMLTDIGVTTLGHALYSEYGEEVVTEVQSMNYLLNQNGIFQVGDVLIKPTSMTSNCEMPFYQYIFAMHSSQLDSATHATLSAGTFNAGFMSKFATNFTDSAFNLLDFMDQNPGGGYEDFDVNLCPEEDQEGDESKAKFWGWRESKCTNYTEIDPQTGQPVQKHYYEGAVYYVFWLPVCVEKDENGHTMTGHYYGPCP